MFRTARLRWIMLLMTYYLLLLIAEPGVELVLEVEGDDAAEAIGPLAELLGSPGETY